MIGNRLAAALLTAALLAAPVLALGPDSGTLYQGIDVSVYQGTIDFAQVREHGVEIIYIRAGEGAGYRDPDFARNAADARAAGLKVGFYHYVTARSTEEARTQAAFFAELIREEDYDCRPAMDFENFSGLSAGEVNAIGLAYLQRLEELTGHVPLLYANAYAAERVWTADVWRYPLWAADYGPTEPDISGGRWSGWAGFQYADDGRVPGIEGNVDLDRFTGAVLLTADPVPPPAPQETYTVRRGDTLWAIARRYGTTVAALAAENGIADPSRIYPGQVLRLPK